MAALRARAKTDDEHEALDEAITIRADMLAGDPIAEIADPYTGAPTHRYDPERERAAGNYVTIARGEAVPMGVYTTSSSPNLTPRSERRATTSGHCGS
jgi:hypothetical protein